SDIVLEAGEASSYSDISQQKKSSGFLSSKSKSQRDAFEDSAAVTSIFSGENVALIADRDVQIKGSNVAATKDATLIAGRDLTIEVATEAHSETHEKRTAQSGVFGSGGVGFTLGSRMNSSDQQIEATTAAKSTVGSVEGNVTLLAGEKYRQVGSDVIAVKGDIDIAAKQVDIVEARETSKTVTKTQTQQSGLTMAITSPVITAIQTAQQMSEAAKDTSDSRMKALAAASTGLAGYNAHSAIQAGQGTTIDGKANQMPVTDDAGKVIGSRDASAAEQVGGVNLSISIGGSKSSSKTTQTSDTAAASNLTAGRDINIAATGAGKNSDLTIQGSKATAIRDIALTADDEIRLLAAANTAGQKSTNKNSSGSVGISFGTDGLLFNVGASAGRGKADGDDLTHTNTHVEAGNKLTLDSGGNTTLKGAVAKGEQVAAKVGGDLDIESRQDTSTYDSQQKSLGGSISVGYGRMSGSVSASSSKIESDYQSVTEQSAIRAGDKGFDVDVKGDTALKGGAITSTQKAIDDQRNQFKTGGELTLSDIENKAEYKAKSTSVNVGTSLSFDGALKPGGTSAGFGKDGDKAESMTLAAISDIAGNKAARTGDKETGIGKIFDQEKVQKEIAAQVKITQMFGQSASKAVGDYAQAKLKEAQTLRDQGREQEAKDIESQWGANGTLRLAAHTVIGGLTGGASGAAGAAAGTLTAPAVAEALAKAGIEGPLATAITAAASTAVGAVVGGTAGAGTAFNEVANNYLNHKRPTMMRLSEKERYEAAVAACANGERSACGIRDELATLSAKRDLELQQACAGGTPEVCNTKAREAIAMGNIVYGQNGQLVYANSPESGPIRFLNVATIGTPGRPDSFHDQLARSTAEGLLLEGQNQLIGALLTAAGKGTAAANSAVKEYFASNGVVVSDEVAARITNNFYRDGAAVDYSRAFEFKAGRTLAAEEANARTLSYGNNALDPKPPYLRDSLVSERLAQPGEKFYVIEYGRQSSPGGWASQKQYTSLDQARNELSLLPEFKSGDLVVREYEVVKPMPIREGTVGPLKSNTGQTYAGGAKQTEFVFERLQPDTWKEFLKRNEAPLKLGN
ncbi:MAG: filamentous hemagglutinin, partial [Pseudomonadota bacterium]|nr:filamentous hemagglutinin [Pseudomonadota bacterium]